MNKLHLALLASPAVVILAASAHSYARGVLPGTTGTWGTIPANIASAAPGCAMCHIGTAPTPVVVSVAPARRSLALGEATTITTSATGGVMHPMNWGGFIAEVTAGTLAAGVTSKIDPTAKFVTHTFSFNGNRSWSFGYTAPTVPGLVKVYAAVNTVDGDSTPHLGNDVFGFHGDPSGQVSVPVRLYANAQNVTERGAGCAGAFNHWPVLGALTPPQIGTTHTLEVHGAAPSQPITLLLGMNPAFALDLTAINIPGCWLYVQSLLDLGNMTSAGSAQSADGTASWAIPLPNNPSLINAVFETQAALLDPANGRPLPVTLTNALSSKIF